MNPTSLDEAAYDISFYGDSLFVAYKTKVAIFFDDGIGFQKLATFGHTAGNAQRIRGGDIKGDLFAYTKSLGGLPFTDGVYLVDIPTLQPLAYTQYALWGHEDVNFGQGNDLLHVMAGTNLLGNGLFLSMDVSNPALPVEVFRDTVPGIPFLGIASPMSAEIRNDTVFVATLASVGDDNVALDSTRIFIYDAANPGNVHKIGEIYAGLWHFDLTLQGNTMHIASEWYGIQTMDISDVLNDQYIGRTYTGGWNRSSDVHGDTLVVGMSGRGWALWDISNRSNPAYIGENNDGGFCYKVRFSADGNYIYGLYSTGQAFRVFDRSTMQEVGTAGGASHTFRAAVYKNFAIAFNGPGGSQEYAVYEVSNAFAPVQLATFPAQMQDLAIDENGLMFVAGEDSLTVFDLENNFSIVETIFPGANEAFRAVASYKDSLFVFTEGKGLVRYLKSGSGPGFTLTEDASIALGPEFPKFMAADSFGVYLGYQFLGLYAYDKASLTEESYYRTGLGFYKTGEWGIWELFTKDNYIYLVEFFAQTSILSNDNGLQAAVNDQAQAFPKDLQLWPNPVERGETVRFAIGESAIQELYCFDLQGKHVALKWVAKGESAKLRADLPAGMYYLVVKDDEGEFAVGKMTVE